MARSVFYREETGPGEIFEATGNPPFNIEGLTNDTPYEVNDGNGVWVPYTPTGLSAPVLRHVEYFSFNVPESSTADVVHTLTTTLNATNKSELFFGFRSRDTLPDRYPAGQILSTTQVGVKRTKASVNAQQAEGYVVEWTSGVSVQRNVATDVSTTQVDIELAGGTDITKSYCKIWPFDGSATTDWTAVGWLWSDGGTPTLSLKTKVGTVDILWEVVSRDDITVQHGVTSFTTGTSFAEAITTVDLAKSFLLLSSAVATGTGVRPGRGLVRGRLTDVDEVTLDRYVSFDLGHEVRWQVITGDNFAVQHINAEMADTVSSSVDAVTTVDLAKSIAFGTNGCFMGRNAYNVNDATRFNSGLCPSQLTDVDEVTTTRHVNSSLEVAQVAVEVVEFA